MSRATTATYLQRPVATRTELPRFLIVCEGKKTEPNYFEALSSDLRLSVHIVIKGLGDNTDSLVERTIALMQANDYAQTWCVFDRDSFPAGHFNCAIQLAASHRIKVAYSNEAFELWYVLHFEYLQSGISRADYIRKLHAYLGKRYQKNSATIYRDLVERQAVAIKHATTLLSTYDPPDPEQDNPSTAVHLLVQTLNSYRRE